MWFGIAGVEAGCGLKLADGIVRPSGIFEDVAQLKMSGSKILVKANGFAQVQFGLAPLIEGTLRNSKVQVRPRVGVSGLQIQINRFLKVHHSEVVLALPVITKTEIVIGLSHVRSELNRFLEVQNRVVVMMSIVVQSTQPVGIKRVLAVRSGKRLKLFARPIRVPNANIGHGQREAERGRQRCDCLRFVPGDRSVQGIVIEKIDAAKELEQAGGLRRMRIIADFRQQQFFRRDVVVGFEGLFQLRRSTGRKPERINLRKTLFRLDGLSGSPPPQRGRLYDEQREHTLGENRAGLRGHLHESRWYSDQYNWANIREVRRRVSRLERASGSRRFLGLGVRMRLLSAAVLGCALLAPQVHAQSSAASYRETVAQIQQQIEDGHLSDAQTLIGAALKSFPSNAGLENLLGVVEAEQGETELARRAFSAAIQHDPKLVGAYLNLGRIEMQEAGSHAGPRAKALQLYQKVLRLDPANPEANFQAATLLMWDGKYAPSLAHLEKADAAMRGEIRVEALRCADEAGLGHRSATSRAAAAMIANPKLSERDAVFVLPALRAARRGDLIDSIFTAANARVPLSAYGLRVLGLAKEAEGKPAEATAVLERAFTLDDTNVAPLVDLTRIALADKQYKQALGYLAHARALKPGDAAFAYEYGRICLKLNLLAEARRAMGEAVKLAPDAPEYNFALGVVSSHAQDASAGLPYLKKYHQMRPNDPDGVLALGTAYFRDDDYPNAALWLKQATENTSTAAPAHYYLGRIFRQQGQYDQALAQLQQAATLQPDNAAVFAEIGQTYLQQRKYPESQKQLQHALTLDANNYVANFALMQLYAQTRDPKLDAQRERFGDIKKKNQEQYQEEMRVIEARPEVALKDK